MEKLISFISNHGTKVLGWLAAIAGGIAVADKDLVLRTLGPNASDWALLITGIAAIIRGHQSTATEKAAKAASSQSGFVRLALVAILALGSVATVASLSGCAAFGIEKPQTFKERLAFAYTTHTAIQKAAANALDAKEITKDDATRVLELADDSRKVLDAARLAFSAGDLSSAEGRLSLATSILIQLQSYLRGDL
jgi:hypothetical protein